MTIKYEKLFKLFDEKEITSYTIRKYNIMGQATWKKIHEGGHIDTRTINTLCKYLQCQPGDILEYVPDNPQGENND